MVLAKHKWSPHLKSLTFLWSHVPTSNLALSQFLQPSRILREKTMIVQKLNRMYNESLGPMLFSKYKSKVLYISYLFLIKMKFLFCWWSLTQIARPGLVKKTLYFAIKGLINQSNLQNKEMYHYVNYTLIQSYTLFL